MRSTLRTSTALIASFAIVSGHLPVAAIAQEFDTSQCVEGEDADACLARLLEEAATAEGATAEDAATEELPAAEAAPETDGAAVVEPRALAEEPVVEEALEPEAPAEEAEAAEAGATEEPAAEAAPEEPVDEPASEDTSAPVEDAGAPATDADPAAAAEAVIEETGTEELPTEAPAAGEAMAPETLPVNPAADDTSDAVEEAAPNAATTTAEENALATALAEAMEEDEAGDGDTTETDPDMTALAETLLVTPDELTAEDAAALEAARATAAAAEEAAATPVDPLAEAQAEVAEAEADAAEAQQSLAIMEEAEPVATATEEMITEDTARRSDQDFGRLLTATTESEAREDDSDRSGLTGTQGLILGGIAGLAIGSIIAGNREVVNRADDRLVVLRPEGGYQVIRDDDTLLRRPGNTVMTETFADGSSRNVITQPDGTQVITVRDRDLRILRRTVVAPDGTRTILIDDIAVQTPVVVSELSSARTGAPALIDSGSADADALSRALAAQVATDRGFSLAQIRSIRAVRDLAPAINLETVTFDTGSAAIAPEQARQLLSLGRYMSEAIAENPREVFLIEGHTDATGSASFNLALSDRRAETAALALTEFFGVAPQNMVIQGYGEEFLLIPTLENERLNRRVGVRRITDLLRMAAAD